MGPTLDGPTGADRHCSAVLPGLAILLGRPMQRGCMMRSGSDIEPTCLSCIFLHNCIIHCRQLHILRTIRLGGMWQPLRVPMRGFRIVLPSCWRWMQLTWRLPCQAHLSCRGSGALAERTRRGRRLVPGSHGCCLQLGSALDGCCRWVPTRWVHAVGDRAMNFCKPLRGPTRAGSPQQLLKWGMR